MDKIPIEKYKWFKNVGQQYAYKGVALNLAEQACIMKINEIIDSLSKGSGKRETKKL